MCDQDHFEKDRLEYEGLGKVTRRQFQCTGQPSPSGIEDKGAVPYRDCDKRRPASAK